jgi:hypothetical protein
MDQMHQFVDGYVPPPVSEGTKLANQLDEKLKASWDVLQSSAVDAEQAETDFAARCIELFRHHRAQGQKSKGAITKGVKYKLSTLGIVYKKALKVTRKYYPSEFKTPREAHPLAPLERAAKLVRPLLSKACEGKDESQRKEIMKAWFGSVALAVLPEQLTYVTLGRKPGPAPKQNSTRPSISMPLGT